MAKSRRMLEREINTAICQNLRESGLVVISQVRLHPSELDIVALDPRTLRLASFEIKRRDWRKTLQQSLRSKLYCHFSVAILPLSLKQTVPTEAFERHGVGLLFYREVKGLSTNIELFKMLRPRPSTLINRQFKSLVYRQFEPQFIEVWHA